MRSFKTAVLSLVLCLFSVVPVTADIQNQVTAVDGVTYGVMPKDVHWLRVGEVVHIGVQCESVARTGWLTDASKCTWQQRIVANAAGLTVEPAGSKLEEFPSFERVMVVMGLVAMVLALIFYALNVFARIRTGLLVLLTSGFAAASTLVLIILQAVGGGFSNVAIFVVVLATLVSGYQYFSLMDIEKSVTKRLWLTSSCYLVLMTVVFFLV